VQRATTTFPEAAKITKGAKIAKSIERQITRHDTTELEEILRLTLTIDAWIVDVQSATSANPLGCRLGTWVTVRPGTWITA